MNLTQPDFSGVGKLTRPLSSGSDICIHMEQNTRICMVFSPWPSILVPTTSDADPFNNFSKPLLPFMLDKGIIQSQDLVLMNEVRIISHVCSVQWHGMVESDTKSVVKA
jgi:hypothetical protein